MDKKVAYTYDEVGFHHIKVISDLIMFNGYTSYLEIGCKDDTCFSRINVPNKTGIDPVSGGTHRMYSDEFFATNKETFDIIFVDGNHHHDQVFKDVTNALSCLNAGGAIVMHDCFPPTRDDESQKRCGTAWRVFAHFRQNNDLDAIVIADVFGTAVLRVRKNPCPISLPKHFTELTYDDLLEHENDWMRRTSIDDAVKFCMS
jgi:hypothetical protein